MKLILIFFSYHAFANVVAPNDYPYSKTVDASNEYIYTQEYDKEISSSIAKITGLNQYFKDSFLWELDELNSHVFVSSKLQIPNAFSTVIPNNVNAYYMGGSYLIDEFAIKSWNDVLLTHEVSHLYQINAKGPVSSFVKSIFGNVPFILPIIPIFTSPNIALPTWIVEGNSVFNESILGMGGRLHSGENKALLYSLIKRNVLNSTRLINNHLSFPFTREKYIVGGFFQLFLSKKFGLKAVNSFFRSHADHFINPLILDSSFQEHFGQSYYLLIEEFVSFHKKNLSNYKTSPEELFATSHEFIPLNRDHNKVWTLIHDGRNPPKLLTVNKKDQSVTLRTLDLPLGKVYFVKNKAYAQTYDLLPNLSLIHGLWDTKRNLLASSHSQHLSDSLNSNLSYSLTESFHSPIYPKVGQVHSLGILDENSNTYYFKQDGNQRILFKNKRKIMAYKGYYGKLLEVNQNNVLFIAATATGSSLFQWNNQKKRIERLLVSDAIVDARKTRRNSYLVAELKDLYHYKLVSSSAKKELPYFDTTITQYRYTPKLPSILTKKNYNFLTAGDFIIGIFHLVLEQKYIFPPVILFKLISLL